MANSNRDEFSETVKRALAFRANHECSFPNCDVVMSGPSLESPTSYVRSGVAAHIHAAAPGPGARRYLVSMTQEERSDISNGIFLCRNHAGDIDGDEVYYTADRLRAMKAEHEERVTARRNGLRAKVRSDFIALGPNLLLYGEVIGADDKAWAIRIDDFVEGDLAKLLRFTSTFSVISPYDQYVAVNALGDGRQLSGTPTWCTTDAGYVLNCPIRARFPRSPAQELEKELALNDEHDLTPGWTIVAGLDALPQRIKSSLSLLRGESPMSPAAGTRITEYFKLFRDSSILSSLVKLETIRLACVPHVNEATGKAYTLLGCVQGVQSVQQLSQDPVKRWLRFRFVLEVEGVIGPWERDISVLVQDRVDEVSL